jgi:hypothetical protein
MRWIRDAAPLAGAGQGASRKNLAPGIAAGSTYRLNSVREWFPVPSHRNCKIARITFSPTAARGCASHFSELWRTQDYLTAVSLAAPVSPLRRTAGFVQRM